MSYQSYTGNFAHWYLNGAVPSGSLDYAGSALYLVVPAASGPATWAALSGEAWTSSANGSSGVIPSGSAVTAIVGTGTSSSQTITLDSPQTVGQLTFTNTTSSTAGYTLAAGVSGSLTMNNSTSAARSS